MAESKPVTPIYLQVWRSAEEKLPGTQAHSSQDWCRHCHRTTASLEQNGLQITMLWERPAVYVVTDTLARLLSLCNVSFVFIDTDLLEFWFYADWGSRTGCSWHSYRSARMSSLVVLIHVLGPLVGDPPAEQLLFVQLFLICCCGKQWQAVYAMTRALSIFSFINAPAGISEY